MLGDSAIGVSNHDKGAADRRWAVEVLAGDPSGDALLAFFSCREDDSCGMVPLPASLVAVWSGASLLLVFDNARREWELPGGRIDPGESPREAAVRELREESGEEISDLSFAGHAQFRLGAERRIEYAAIFAAEIARPTGVFVPGAEISACCWWDEMMTPPPGFVQPMDLTLAHLARQTLNSDPRR
ncbi:NUDIX hydrolase [Acrocarpospora corrugata]|nr:NUDIX hydrolase [Acrocarpospora corrugata]